MRVHVMGPYIKDEHSYFSPSSWADPNPEDQHGNMLGGICHYYLVQALRRNPGARSLWSWPVSARTPEAAEAATRRFLDEEGYEAIWLTVDEARALEDGTGRCPSCGRRAEEVPIAHRWDAVPCEWTGSWAPTRWWPDGTIRDDYWREES